MISSLWSGLRSRITRSSHGAVTRCADPRRKVPLVAAIAAMGVCAGGAQAQSERFDWAVQMYKQGRWPAAFGNFVALADQGDPDAAHIAFFMSRYGPQLYGSHWDADPGDMTTWSGLILDRTGKKLPVFVPDPYLANPRARGLPARPPAR